MDVLLQISFIFCSFRPRLSLRAAFVLGVKLLRYTFLETRVKGLKGDVNQAGLKNFYFDQNVTLLRHPFWIGPSKDRAVTLIVSYL